MAAAAADPRSANEITAEAAKERGNEAMKAEKYNQAVSHYTEALRMAPTNHVYSSNRSLAYGKTKDWDNALKDAQKCIELQPVWSKGYTRKGTALQVRLRLPNLAALYLAFFVYGFS